MHYLELLRRLHDELHPAGYLEIGVDWGDSLGLSRARSVAIDPAPKPRPEALLGKPGLMLYVGTSDGFFREQERETMLRDAPLDLAFIDGLHEFAQVVRDLEHVERWGHPETVVAIHDVLPRNAWEATHAFHDGFWTGDVWRIVPFLQEHRPDLRLWLTQAEPTGMLIVTGLDPAHPGMAHLAEADDAVSPPAGPEYDRLVEAFIADAVAVPAEEVLRALGLGRRLDRDWEYETKWGMRLVAESSWRPLLEAAASLDHTNQHRDGLRACLRLIDAHWLPEGVREQAFEHLVRYASPLADLWPDATSRALAVPGTEAGAMRSPGPVLLAGALMATVQTSTANGSTSWSLLTLDSALHVQTAVPLRIQVEPGADQAGDGASIARVQPFVHDGGLLAFVTMDDRDPRGVAPTGLFTIADGALRDRRPIGGPAGGRCQPAWAPLPMDEGLRAVSWWEPTETRHIDPVSGETSRATLRPAPRIAEHVRGGSAGVPVPGGWLFLIDERYAVGDEDAPVFARFVLLRSDFRVTAVSPHFWVSSHGQDTVGGLTRQGDDVIAGFTSATCGALLVRIPIDEIVRSLIVVASPGDTSGV